MKRTLRTYVSALLLLCLAVQLAPFGLIHSHDEHHDSERIHVSHADHDHELSEAIDFEHNADFQFDSNEECDFCEVLHALNDQSYVNTLQTQATMVEIPNLSSTAVFTAEIEAQVSQAQGRAPPTA